MEQPQSIPLTRQQRIELLEKTVSRDAIASTGFFVCLALQGESTERLLDEILFNFRIPRIA